MNNCVPISDSCKINPKKSEIKQLDVTTQVSFVGMKDVTEDGMINASEKRSIEEVYKGFTYFAEGDILFAKITPCMENGKGCIARGLHNKIGFGSTEFHVLRPYKDTDGKYIFYLLKSKSFRLQAEANMSGSAGQKRVPARFFDKFKIPLPLSPTQKHIAAILDEADKLRQLNKQLIEKYGQLTQSLFLEMFGDPVVNPMGWEMHKFADVGKLDRGKSKHRPRNAPELLGGPYPFVQTGDVANCDRRIINYKATYSEVGLAQSKMWQKGTLCITIAANIAKTGILDFDACFPDSIVGFIPNEKTNSTYIQSWLSFLQKILEDSAPESAQKNINLAILRKLEIPTPPISLQSLFKERISGIEQEKDLVRQSVRKSEELFQSLLQKAFKGDVSS